MIRLIWVTPNMRVRCFQSTLLIVVIAFGCTDRGSGAASAFPDGGAGVGSHSPDVTVPSDQQVDETAPEASPPEDDKFVCISDWPTQEPAIVAPSLDLPRFTLVGVDTTPDNGLGDHAAFSAGRIGMSGHRWFVSYDVSARTFVEYGGVCGTLSDPVIRRDAPGGFVIGCGSVLGFFPDLQDPSGPAKHWPDEGIEWTRRLGPNKYPILKNTVPSDMLVDPEGTIYFAASDESFTAMRPADGSAVWTRELVVREYDFGSPAGRLGIGNRLFFGDSMVFERATGEQVAGLTVKGVPVSVQAAAYSRRLIGAAQIKPFDPAELVVLDECGKLKWARGPKDGYHVLVGFDDSLVVGEYKEHNTPVFYRFSIDGTVIAGPASYANWVFPFAIGADDVLYLASCVPCYPCYHDKDLEVIAVSQSMEVIDRINLGGSCRRVSAVLLDDGLMVVMRVGLEGNDFVRIQTASPGLARTAWPAVRRDNERTGWVAPW
ncbi:MAG: hypothetical protein FWD57_07690 [Polyangiaceae bacterium]|nr:hypothetical protein [Polyangiaceae bacterium]